MKKMIILVLLAIFTVSFNAPAEAGSLKNRLKMKIALAKTTAKNKKMKAKGCKLKKNKWVCPRTNGYDGY